MTIQEGQATRLQKARELVDSRSYVVTTGSVFVFSDSADVAGYTVEAGGACSCPDATVGFAARNLGGLCKHRLLVEAVLTARMLIEQQPERARELVMAS